MSKEKQCECCHKWWYGSDVKEDLCPNYYYYFKQLKQQLEEKDKEIERLKVFEKVYYQNQIQASQETINKLLQSAYQSPIAIGLNQIAITELEKVKVNLKDRISMMKNEEHSYLQKVVAWYDICDQINQQIKELKGE